MQNAILMRFQVETAMVREMTNAKDVSPVKRLRDIFQKVLNEARDTAERCRQVLAKRYGVVV